MGSVLQTMDFDQWQELAESDPETFESARLTMIDEVIESAPPAQQKRLRCLQWRIDQERRLSNNPLGACIRLSSMMWDSVIGEEGLLDSLQRLSDMPDGLYRPPRKPRVIPFPPSAD